MSYTEQLIAALNKHGVVITGTESVSKVDGVKYRYDIVELKYKSAHNWLVRLFEKAAVENGAKSYETKFFSGDSCFSYDRPVFKGSPNGKIGMSLLVIL